MTKGRVKRLELHLRRIGLGDISKPGEPLKVVGLKPLTHQGLSGLTFLLTLAEPQVRLILKLYRNRGKALKELRLLDFIRNAGVPVPQAYGVDLEGDVLGRPFLIMEEIRSEGRGEPELMAEKLAATLYLLHSLDPDTADRKIKLERKSIEDELREIKLLSLLLLIISLPPPLPMIRSVLRALGKLKKNSRDRKSASGSLLHGDCGLDNILYSRGAVYLIDLEEAFVGDPAYDVSYAYHSISISNRFGPDLADRFVSAYEELSGPLENLSLYKRIVALKMSLLLRLLRNPGPLMGLLLGSEKVKMILKGRRFLKSAEGHYLNYAEGGDRG